MNFKLNSLVCLAAGLSLGLMHAMGGAGTLLGSKRASEWAAIAAMARAAFLMNNNRADILKGIKEPVIITQGDADMQVPVTKTRMGVDTMKELKLSYQYKEIPGADHGSVIEQEMPDIFAFFKAHTKS